MILGNFTAEINCVALVVDLYEMPTSKTSIYRNLSKVSMMNAINVTTHNTKSLEKMGKRD